MYRVKIYGAGSIGNHLANASRAMGWEVHICDLDDAALERTRSQIYPSRYGNWDDSIKLFNAKNAPKGGYDMIFIGTPPSSHLSLALECIKEKPKAIQVEKPLCNPDLAGAQDLYNLARESGVRVFVGYNHTVAWATEKVEELLKKKAIGKIETLDVEFREHWGGIFSAHPWLKGPSDSYLGFWRKGGGASGEHSHAINLWQHLAHECGLGRVTEVGATMEYVKADGAEYDKLCLLNLRTESGFTGRVVQDVVTQPPRKWARIQGGDGFIECHINQKPGLDAVSYLAGKGETQTFPFPKTRPDDFIQELKHMDKVVQNGLPSPLDLGRGLETMMVVAAAHKAAQEARVVKINHDKGFTLAALN
jgi:predicted dehydrogenase